MGMGLTVLGIVTVGFRQVFWGDHFSLLQNVIMPSTLQNVITPSTLLVCKKALAPIKPLANVTKDHSVQLLSTFSNVAHLLGEVRNGNKSTVLKEPATLHPKSI